MTKNNKKNKIKGIECKRREIKFIFSSKEIKLTKIIGSNDTLYDFCNREELTKKQIPFLSILSYEFNFRNDELFFVFFLCLRLS